MRSVRGKILLLGGLLLTALSVWRRPSPALTPKPQEPVGAFSTFSLIAACAAILLAAVLWLATQRWTEAREWDAAARAMTGGDPRQAVTLMIRYGCAGCHTIPGVPGADGQVGAPLMQMRKRVFIAGALPNTASNLIDWIVQPEAHDPHSAMPITGITRAEARDVAAWLYSR
jgi:mono/diheme cytochrome c family protein